MVPHNSRNTIPFADCENLNEYNLFPKLSPRNQGYKASQKNPARSGNAEGVLGIDDRQIVTDRSQYPYRTVGLIVSRWKGNDGILYTKDDYLAHGSGALISEYHVLTAGHVIHHKPFGGFADIVEFAPGSGGRPIGKRWAFDQFASSDERFGRANATFLRTFPGWANAENYNVDLGVISLDRNLGKFTGWMSYGFDNTLQPGTWVNVAGYPGDFFDLNLDGREDNYDMTTHRGRITSLTPHQLKSTELDYVGGNSGGPLWMDDSQIIYGVVSHSHTINGVTVTNNATRITPSTFNAIQSWIKQDNATRSPVDRPDLVEYDTWFGTKDAGVNKTIVRPGEALTITAYPQNMGTAASGRFRVSFYASTDGDVTDNTGRDFLIGSRMMSSLAPFKWNTASWSGAFPNIPAGRYHIVAFIDPHNGLRELNDLPASNQSIIGTVLNGVRPDRTTRRSRSTAPVQAPALAQNPAPLDTESTSFQRLQAMALEPTTVNRSTSVIRGTNGPNALTGTNNPDDIFALSGNDRCYGLNGADMINGGAGNDLIFGDAGDDVLLGGGHAGGSDSISGGRGDDLIVAGQVIGQVGKTIGTTRVVDRDLEYILGGTGSDTFVVGLGQGIQWIEDFQVGRDEIALTAGMRLGQITLTRQQDGVLVRHGQDDLAFLRGVPMPQSPASLFLVS